MVRPLFFMLALAASTWHAQAQAAVQSPQVPAATFRVIARPLGLGQAPADEYFGRYRLSSLGIRNAIRDMTIEGDSPLALPLQTERIAAVESALPAWADKYPRDPWVPSAIAKFAVFLISKRVPQCDRPAVALLSYLQLAYPQTWYASYAQAHLDALDMLPNIDMQSGPTVGQLVSVSEYYGRSLSVRRPR
jgi:hypothetical protein